MTRVEKIPVVRRDLGVIYGRISRAKDMVSMTKNPELWNVLDLAMARAESLAFFVGGTRDDIVDPTP